MTMLREYRSKKDGFSSDINPQELINSTGASFLIGKAIEELVELPSRGENDFKNHLAALYYIFADLEENFGFMRNEWAKDEIIRYIADFSDKEKDKAVNGE